MQLDLLQSSDMICMTVSNEKIINLLDSHTELVEGLTAFRTTINQQMLIAFDDEYIGLIERLCKRRTCPNKKER